MAEAITPEQLLSEATWLRRLAARLADDRDDADDLTQDAWIAAWQQQPDPNRPLRPWLAKVVRDAARMRRRSELRRTTREAASVVDATVATPEELLAQARLHQTLVKLVLDLEEPYRATVLARFVEGRTAPDIARTSGVPEGTVRWRMSEALKRLRDRLDARATKRAWIPLAAIGQRAAWMSSGKTVAAVVGLAVLLILLVVGGLGGFGRGSKPPPISPPTSPTVAGDSPQHHKDGDAPAPSWLIPADASTGPIAGRVVSEDGTPIAGALVQLQSWGAAPSGGDEARVVTTSDGTFRFSPRWSAFYVVAASAANRAPSSVPVDPRAPSDRSDPTKIVLVLSACTQSAEGTVTDAGGGPIVGATVQRLTVGLLGPFGATAISDADGRYSLCLPRGSSWLDIGADGYEHVLREVSARGRQRVDVSLAPGANVTGQVVDASTGEPISGVWVSLWPLQRRSGEGGDRSTVTRSDGRFAIDGLAANRYMLTARDGDHIKTVIDEVEVAAVTGTRPVTIRMERGIELHGIVRSGDAAVAHARVKLDMKALNWGGSLPTPLYVVTDAGGAFTFRGVPRAASMIPKVAGYEVLKPAIVDTRAPISDLVLDVQPLPTLHGIVLRDGVPVAGADVTAMSPSGPRLKARTDEAGLFTYLGVAPGRYELFAASEAVGAFSTRPVAATVPDDATITVELDGGATITGSVRDETGTPVVGAEVVAVEASTNDNGTSVTAVDGGFTIDSLSGGEYKLRVRPYVGAEGTLGWADGAPGDVSLEGGRANAGPVVLVVKRVEGPITGTVVDHGGAPVADAIVRLGPVWGWTTGVPIARTDTDGRFRLVAIGDGPFSIDAGTGGGPLGVVNDVAPGATDVVIRLVRPGAIDGTLVGLPGARIWARRTGGIAAAASVPGKNRTTQADGNRFYFEGLVPGDYTLLAVTSETTASGFVHLDEGEVAAVSLGAGASRTISGRVTRFGNAKAVPGMPCTAVPATGDVRPPGINGTLPNSATTDATGRFTIEHAPAGDALVVCLGIKGYSSGAARLAADGDARVEVVAVPPQVPGWFGFGLNESLLNAFVDSGASDEAMQLGIMPGDRVVAVDGQNVESLYENGVYWLIAGRAYGTTASITFERDGARFTVRIPVEGSR